MLSSKPNFCTITNFQTENDFITHVANSDINTSAKATKKSQKHGNRKPRSKDGGKAIHANQQGRRSSVKKSVRFILPTNPNTRPNELCRELKNNQKAEKDPVSNHKHEPDVARHLPSGWNTEWKSASQRWVARLEHLVEMDLNSVKLLPAKPPIESLVRFCDNQRHLLLGNGPDFSSVYMGILSDGTEVAVKKVNTKRASLLLDMDVMKGILAAPSDSLLTKTYFITRDKTHFYVVKDLGEYSLKQELKRLQYLIQSQKEDLKTSYLCYEIAKAVGLLHSSNLIHMALKPENVIVNAQGQGVSLTDYGLHARIPPKQQQKGETCHWLCWQPAEIVGNCAGNSKKMSARAEKYTTASDVASLGMLFYHIMTEGGHPFGDHENAHDTCLNNIKHGSYNLKAILDPFAHHLVKNMIFKEPDKRLVIDQVLCHPYFWSVSDRNQYVSSLVMVALSGFHMQSNCTDSIECDQVLDQLRKNEPFILGSYVNLDEALQIPEGCLHNIEDLLAFVWESSEDELLINNNNCDLRRFFNCFPGLLLCMYSEFPLQRLLELSAELQECGKILRCCDLLQPCLSTDSGILESPNIAPKSLDFGSRSTEDRPNHLDYIPANGYRTGRFTSADDGIDVVTPAPGSLTDDGVFFPSASSLSCSPALQPSGWNIPKNEGLLETITSPGSYGSSVDNHFEFDRGDCSQRLSECENDLDLHTTYEAIPLWTDIDELD